MSMFDSAPIKKNPFDDFEVVLVEPQHSGNMGAVARAMRNMGFEKLTLVNPIGHHLNKEAISRALHARDLLEKARVCQSLSDAVAGCERVVGMTGKIHDGNKMTPREFAEGEARIAGRKIALVFGPEDAGLRKEHLTCCDAFIRIPVSEAFTSINLSHAVVLILYEIRMAINSGIVNEPRKLAEFSTREEFHLHLKEALTVIQYLGPRKPNHIFEDLKQLFSRAQLDDREVKILRGVLTQVLHSAGGRIPRAEFIPPDKD